MKHQHLHETFVFQFENFFSKDSKPPVFLQRLFGDDSGELLHKLLLRLRNFHVLGLHVAQAGGAHQHGGDRG